MPITVTLLVIASVVAVSLLAWASRAVRSALVLSPMRIRERYEVHRLLTAGWLHADIGHLLFNLLTLYSFGTGVERALGPLAYVALYVSAVVVAFVPSTIRHFGDPRYSSLGASGAVAAVMFSAILLFPTIRVGIPFVPVAVPGLYYALFYLGYSALSAYRSHGNVNHEAHFAGALHGVLVTYLLAPDRVAATLRQLF